MSPDPDLFVLSFQRFVERLQREGYEVGHTLLGNGAWTVTVNPRPFLVIRTRYSDVTQELVVCIRRPFPYQERLRVTLDAESLDNAVARAVALHGPARG